MRRALLPLLAPALLALACTPGGRDDDVDAGPSGGDGGVVPDGGGGDDVDAGVVNPCRCDVQFSFAKGAATSCQLRGDFKVDGWSSGAEMTLNGDRFEVTLNLAHRQVVTYKFVTDGSNWQADSENPLKASDGYGGQNSIRYIECASECPAGAPSKDWSDAVMYFALVDRFANGDNTNDQSVPDVEWPAQYQGGDLAGVLAKLREGYFNRLGITALWLSSPSDNAHVRGQGDDGRWYSAYHGYWPKELGEVDARVGDMALLKQVVTEAHQRGIRVLLDYVMNHVHDTSSVYAQHPDWFYPNQYNGHACICGEGCSWDADDTRMRCWFRPYLPDFDFTKAEARAWSVDNAIWWAKETGVDGFRLDAVKHIDTRWLTELRTRLTNEVEKDGSHFYLVGETYTGSRDVIKAYISPTMLDGQFDFPMRYELVDKVLHRAGRMAELASFLADNDRYYGSAAIMGTFLGNHDLPRSIHHAEDTPLFSNAWDSGRDRGWNNTPQASGDRKAYERMLLGMAMLLTSGGIPLVYYGDEIGMPGGGDPDNRRMMQWSGTTDHQEFLRSRLARLAAIRAAHPALRKGQRTVIGWGDHVLTYKLKYGTDEVFVSVNRSDGKLDAAGLPAGVYVDLLENTTFQNPIRERTAVVLVRK